MSNNEKEFVSIAKLASDGVVSIAKLATAIELETFYTWDQFRRLVKVSPELNSDLHTKLTREVLKELAAGYKGWEFDMDYYQSAENSVSLLASCGWLSDYIPDFDNLTSHWNAQNDGQNVVPPKATDPKDWDTIYKVLYSFIYHYLDGDTDELHRLKPGNNLKSKKLSPMFDSLGMDAVTTEQTFRNKIQDAIEKGEFDIPQATSDKLKAKSHRNKLALRFEKELFELFDEQGKKDKNEFN